MPRFIAEPTKHLARRISEAEQWFQIPIELPPELTPERTGDTQAYISNVRQDTVISRKLAARLGAKKEGDSITVVIRQQHKRKLHRFELPITVNFAPDAWGNQFLLIGTGDLGYHFELALLQHATDPAMPDYFYMRILDETELECVESELPWAPDGGSSPI